MQHRTVYWFRKALRLHDNPALVSAYENAEFVWPIFILDPWFVKNYQVGPNRWRFLRESLQDLDKSLKSVNGRLLVIRGNPLEVLPELFEDWKVTRLAFEVDTEPYALTRDSEVENLCREHHVEIMKKISHTLYDSDRIIQKNGGSPPMTYQKFQSVVSQIGNPDQPCEKLSNELANGCTYAADDSALTSQCHHIPTLEELGLDDDSLGEVLYPGGETQALKRMDKYLKRTNWICNFEKPQTEPNSIEPSTTVLSPYLKFGCLSARTFFWKLKEIYSSSKKHTQPPVSLHGQLLWREFFYTVGYATPNFNKMEGNSVCRQIPWDSNADYLEAWKNAKTGYPFIDAIMTQLRQEGWIHHLARHAVACFLTRGDLWISWEEGQKVFEELLLDADWYLNAANWMWLSASAFFNQYFRVYSPVAFGQKTDKDGLYIKKYLPILKKIPAKYIYEPWKAPLSVQKAAGCVIGQDYPKPIVAHDKIRPVNIQRMKQAYAQASNSTAQNDESSTKKRSSSSDTNSPKLKKQKSTKRK